MNKNILYMLLLLVAYRFFYKSSEKFIEYLSNENAELCSKLNAEYEKNNCKSLLDKINTGFINNLTGGLVSKIGGDVIGAISKEPEECLRIRQELYLNKC
jgi:hypothetical protein